MNAPEKAKIRTPLEFVLFVGEEFAKSTLSVKKLQYGKEIILSSSNLI
jgi:hypothetical protein